MPSIQSSPGDKTPHQSRLEQPQFSSFQFQSISSSLSLPNRQRAFLNKLSCSTRFIVLHSLSLNILLSNPDKHAAHFASQHCCKRRTGKLSDVAHPRPPQIQYPPLVKSKLSRCLGPSRAASGAKQGGRNATSNIQNVRSNQCPLILP